MKHILTSKILQKVVILSILVVGLVFIAASDNVQTVQAAPCCSECPGGGDPIAAEEACFMQCGGFNSCFYSCRNQAYNCYSHCIQCGGSNNCGVCYSSGDCFTQNCAGLGSGPNGSGYCTCP